MINLLPKELTTKTKVDRVASIVKNAAIIVTFLFVLGVVAGVGVILLSRNNLEKAQVNQATLSSNIRSLEAAENGLVLVKDRVSKIQILLDTREQEFIFAKQVEIVESMPTGLSFSDSAVEEGMSFLGILGTSSVGIKNFFGTLVNNRNYSSIFMQSLQFNPYLGYQMNLEIF